MSAAAPEAGSRLRGSAWRSSLLVAAAALAAFLPALANGFVLDDHLLIEQSETIRNPLDLGPIWFGSFWGADRFFAYYRPMVTQSFALNYLLGGLSPSGYHAVNLLLHAAAALLLHRVARRWLQEETAALLAALLFAVHPLAAESVSPVYGRTDLMATAFGLGALALYLRPGRLAAPRLAAIGGLYLLALLSKESVLLLPLVFLISDALRPAWEREAAGPAAAPARWRGRLPAYAALAGAAAVYLALRRLALGGLLAGAEVEFLHNPLVRAGLVERLLTAPLVLVRYLQLWLFPLHLSPDYSYNELPIVTSFADPRFLYCAVLCAGFAALGVWTARRAPRAFLGWGFFVALYALVSNAVLPVGALLAERFLYTPMAGLCLMAGAAARGLLPSRAGRPSAAAALVVTLVLGALAVVSFRRAPDWRDDLSVARAVVEATPRSAMGHNNLGVALLGDNPLPGSPRLREAALSFARAIEIYPDYPLALFNLGAAFLLEGRPGDALNFFQRLETIDPGYRGLQYQLGLALFRLRRDDEALEHLDRALAQFPDDLNLLNDYGAVLETVGQDARAREVLLRALEVGGPAPNTLFNLAVVEIKLGRFGDASGRIDALLERNARDAGAHVLRGRVLLGLGDRAGAEAAYRKALELDGELAEGWYRLGLLLAGAGSPDEAEAAMQRAAELGHEAAASAVDTP